MDFSAEIATSISQIEADEWDAIINAAGAPVFYRHWFLESYERFPLQAPLAIRYILCRDKSNGRLVGVCPVYLQPPMDPFCECSGFDPEFRMEEKQALLTHVWHCYDTNMPILPGEPEAAATIIRAIGETALQLGAAWYGIVNVTKDKTEARNLASCLTAFPICDRFVLDLHAFRTLEDYVRSLSSNLRRNCRRDLRAAEAEGTLLKVDSGSALDSEAAETLCRATAAKHGFPDYYPRSRFAKFLDSISEHVTTVRVCKSSGEIAAWFVCFLDGHRFHLWAGGCRFDLSRYSPFKLAVLKSIEHAIDRGCTIIEGGRSNEKIKRRFGMRAISLNALLAKA